MFSAHKVDQLREVAGEHATDAVAAETAQALHGLAAHARTKRGQKCGRYKYNRWWLISQNLTILGTKQNEYPGQPIKKVMSGKLIYLDRLVYDACFLMECDK